MKEWNCLIDQPTEDAFKSAILNYYSKQVSDCFRSVKILPDSRIIYVRNVTIRLLYVFFVLFQNSNRKIRCYQFIIL